MDKESLRIGEGQKADLLILHGEDQGSIESVALRPLLDRTIIRQGEIVAQRSIVDTILQK